MNFAKIALATSLFCLSSVAAANQYTSIDTLSSLSIEGDNLSLSYATAGGCEEHEAVVKVQISKSGTAKLRVMDKTEAPDMCEAMVYVTTSVSLNDLVAEEAARLGVSADSLKRLKLELPAVEIK